MTTPALSAALASGRLVEAETLFELPREQCVGCNSCRSEAAKYHEHPCLYVRICEICTVLDNSEPLYQDTDPSNGIYVCANCVEGHLAEDEQ